ncbi:DUF6338 family protein [Microbispora sp. NPDC049125]|uniref:DUF6338 family protein n=1 Tax=Microbispora sp. NPDC049125 TaxID=3154929 RepID=UPI0034669B68
MPTTFTGLLLFVVLLLPGFAYLVVRERVSTERRLSPFRETGVIAFVSVIAELAVLGVFALMRVLAAEWTPDIGRLIRDGPAYVRTHYASLGLWGVGLLLIAVLAAAAAGRWLLRQPHSSTVSAWWQMFEIWHPGLDRHVVCLLDDGSSVEGYLTSFNRSAEDTPDRDLILEGPLKHRLPNEAEPVDYPASVACISARRIVTLFVTYVSIRQRDLPNAISPSPSSEHETAGASPSAVEVAPT